MPGALKSKREESLRSSRVVRYLSYGIGEVLLIFVGITLAIAFDNWNDQKKTDALERQILGAIVRNLEANVEELGRNIRGDEIAVSGLEPVLEVLIAGTPWDDSLVEPLEQSMNWSSPYFATSGYESLKQLGLHLVSDDQLRDQLVDLHETTYAILLGDFDKSFWAFYEAVLLPVRNRELELFKPEGEGLRAFRPRDYEETIRRGELLHALQEHRYRLQIGLEERRGTLSKTEGTIESIRRFLASGD